MTAATFDHAHLVRDLTARILDRLALQESRAPRLLAELGLADHPRLAVPVGLVLVGPNAEPAQVGRESLAAIAAALGREAKENPTASAIGPGDLVLLRVGPEQARAPGKALLARLDKQCQAIAHSGAMGVVVLECFNAWPREVRQKLATSLQKAPCPRLFVFFGHDPSLPDAPSLPLLDKCQQIEVGPETPACRRRAAPA